MPDVKWTPAQAAAIADRGGTLLVSAAAGSGKTAVLAERAVGLITDPVHPAEADRLLIVTFTNAAAAELRARIAGRLGEEVKKQPGSARPLSVFSARIFSRPLERTTSILPFPDQTAMPAES